MWFEELTGFAEQSPDQVLGKLYLEGPAMVSRVNQRRMIWGEFETPTLAELRHRVKRLAVIPGRLQIHEVVDDVRGLHMEPGHGGALFQAASQFNLLEMVAPTVPPEAGIGIYEHDPTQGPACAMVAGAGTIYRNYFVPLGDQLGQSVTHQIDCLAEIGDALGNHQAKLWTMLNGYALASEKGLVAIARRLRAMNDSQRDELRGRLRIGLQWHTEVTEGPSRHLVSQAYCSALPVAYTGLPTALWEPFGRLILEAAYEATLLAGVLNVAKTGNPRVFLTMLGGGAFGNPTAWIVDACKRAFALHATSPIAVHMVSYWEAQPWLEPILTHKGPGSGPERDQPSWNSSIIR